MAKAAVLPFKPRVIDCDADTKELLERLWRKAGRSEIAGVVVTVAFKSGEECAYVSGSLNELDKAIASTSRTWRLLSDG